MLRVDSDPISYPYKMELVHRRDTRDVHTQRKARMRAQQETVWKPRKEAYKKTNIAGTLILDFWPS